MRGVIMIRRVLVAVAATSLIAGITARAEL
jgi:hypothetical protein